MPPSIGKLIPGAMPDDVAIALSAGGGRFAVVHG